MDSTVSINIHGSNVVSHTEEGCSKIWCGTQKAGPLSCFGGSSLSLSFYKLQLYVCVSENGFVALPSAMAIKLNSGSDDEAVKLDLEVP